MSYDTANITPTPTGVPQHGPPKGAPIQREITKHDRAPRRPIWQLLSIVITLRSPFLLRCHVDIHYVIRSTHILGTPKHRLATHRTVW